MPAGMEKTGMKRRWRDGKRAWYGHGDNIEREMG